MVKLKEGNTAPVSKYAAKKAKVSDKAKETKVESDRVEETSVEKKPVAVTPKPKGKTVIGKKKYEINIDIPEHVLKIAYIVNDNAAIRRFTSLNILNYLAQVGRIKKDGPGNYVKFLWNKFRVHSNGLTNEYYYNETFFLKALVNAFSQFASDAQNSIGMFMEEEDIANIDE